MPPSRVRIATIGDLDLLVRHRRGMWEDIADFTRVQLDAGDRVYRQWLRARMKSGRFVGFIVESSTGEPVASGGLWLLPDRPRPTWKKRVVPYLMSMYTEPDHRGRGHGTRIVREAIRWARRHGFERMTLHASDYGQGIYRREGFRRTPEMQLRFRRATRIRRKRRIRRPTRRRR